MIAAIIARDDSHPLLVASGTAFVAGRGDRTLTVVREGPRSFRARVLVSPSGGYAGHGGTIRSAISAALAYAEDDLARRDRRTPAEVADALRFVPYARLVDGVVR